MCGGKMKEIKDKVKGQEVEKCLRKQVSTKTTGGISCSQDTIDIPGDKRDALLSVRGIRFG